MLPVYMHFFVYFELCHDLFCSTTCMACLFLYIQKDKFLSFNLIYNTYASGTSDKLFGYISIVPLRNFNKLTNIVRNVIVKQNLNNFLSQKGT